MLSTPFVLLLALLIAGYWSGLAVGFGVGVAYARAGRRPLSVVIVRPRRCAEAAPHRN